MRESPSGLFFVKSLTPPDSYRDSPKEKNICKLDLWITKTIYKMASPPAPLQRRGERKRLPDI
jgi:hypothetical protein